jgi:hypothetical protein
MRAKPDTELDKISTYCRSLARIPNGTVAYDHLNRAWRRITREPHKKTWLHLVTTESLFMAGYSTRTFANFTLTEDDARKFADWVQASSMQPLDALQEVIGQGYKVSVTWVMDSSAFCLSIIGTEDTKPNKNSIMTTWSDDLVEVMLLAAYKHLVLCDSGPWPTKENTRRWG